MAKHRMLPRPWALYWAVALGMLLSTIAGCGGLEGQASQDAILPSRLLDIDRAHESLHQLFPKLARRRESSSGFEAAAIDEVGVVTMRCHGRETAIQYELITGTRTENGCSIRVNSCPMSLEEAKVSALAICQALKIPNGNIIQWFQEKQYEDPLPTNCLQNGTNGELNHSVDIRRSFNEVRPWRVLYTLNIGNDL